MIRTRLAPACVMAFVVSLAVPSSLALAQAAAKDSSSVTFKSGSDEVKAYLALPKTAGKHPALVVIQEWWGLNDWIKEQANALAGEGYVALAVDLYRGKVTSDPSVAHELMRGLPEDRALRDLNAGVEFLRARAD